MTAPVSLVDSLAELTTQERSVLADVIELQWYGGLSYGASLAEARRRHPSAGEHGKQ